MQPYYSDDLVTLYLGNCLDQQEWLSADALVSDPPYGRDWKQGELKGHFTENRDGIAGDRDTAVRDDCLVRWGSTRPAVMFGDLMLPPPAGTKQVLVYRKQNNAGLRGATGGFRRDAEAIYLIGPWSSGLGGTTSVIDAPAGNASEGSRRFRHPHAKPVPVMARLVGAVPGVVADPFAGSGSTLVAAKLAGRRAIGVELDEAHCEMAARRLGQQVLDFGDWEDAS